MDKEEKEFELEIDISNYLSILKKRRKLIYYIFFFSVVLSAIISLLMARIYKTEVTLMPIEPGRGLSSSVFSLGGDSLPFLSGFGSRFGGGSLTKLSNILESRSVAESVIKSLNLDRIFFEDDWDNEKKKWKNNPPPSMEQAVRALMGLVNISPNDKMGLLTVSVEYKDPKLAAKIANEFLFALQKFINENTMTLAKKNRINLEKQLKKTKEDLVRTEEILATFQQDKKIVELDKQTESAIRASGDLKAKLVAKKVELGVIKKFSTNTNPDVRKLNDEITELEKQIEMINIGENDGKPPRKGDRVFLPFTETADVGLNYIRLKRDVLAQEKVYELLSQQYELAKIDEAKDSIDFVVIDKAVPPEVSIKPKRRQNVMVAGIASLFIGIFLAFFLEYREKVKKESNEQ